MLAKSPTQTRLAPQTAVAIEVTGLGKSYGAHIAVEPFNLTIRQGEFFSLLGPSGCGKSTILRLIAGFTEATAGTIRISGRDVGVLPPEKRDIGIVVQNYAIFPNMDVFENVAFGLRTRKRPQAEIVERVGKALAQVGLSGLERRYDRELSGGQRQRVALARAIVIEPKLLLLDEPLSALDARIRGEMRIWLKELQLTLGITTLFVTHDQAEAFAMSDRIAVLHNGRLEQVATPNEIYERPASRFVAGFIGETNLLSARIKRCSSVAGAADIAGIGEVVLPTGGFSVGDEVEVLVRPENLLLQATNGPAAARIVAVGYEGAQLRYQIASQGESFLSIAANRRGGEQFVVNQGVSLSVEPGAVVIVGGKKQ